MRLLLNGENASSSDIVGHDVCEGPGGIVEYGIREDLAGTVEYGIFEDPSDTEEYDVLYLKAQMNVIINCMYF